MTLDEKLFNLDRALARIDSAQYIIGIPNASRNLGKAIRNLEEARELLQSVKREFEISHRS